MRIRNWTQRVDAKTLLDATSTIKQAIDLGKQVRQFYIDRKPDRTFRISIRENDAAFHAANKWLLNLIPKEDVREVAATTTKDGLKLIYNSKKVQVVELEGHQIEVSMDMPTPPSQSIGNREMAGSYDFARYLTFTCKSREAVEAVKRLLVRLYEEAMSSPPTLYTPSRWDGWVSRGPVNKRPLDSIVLKDGVVDFLVNDITQFVNSQQRYVDLGIPYHRGYLLYGPPGTGKTSIARALSGLAGGDVHALNLSSVKDNDALNSKMAEMESDDGSVVALVLEDIDVVRSTQSRETQDSEYPGVTLDGLLNVLDGMFTPDGIIFFMTTNNIEGFDEALIRPGRADVKIEIGYMDNDQLRRLISRLMPGGPWTHLPTLPYIDESMKVTPAEIVGFFKEHLHNPEAAYRQVNDFILERIYATDSIH